MSKSDTKEFSFKSRVRLRNDGKHKGSWHFVTVDKKVGEKIKKIADALPRKGRGSVKVEAMIGFIKRQTSIFPSKEFGGYILPIKTEIRKELRIEDGSDVMVVLKLI